MPNLFAPIGSVIPSFVYSLRRGNAKHAITDEGQRRLSMPVPVEVGSERSVDGEKALTHATNNNGNDAANAAAADERERLSAVSPIPKERGSSNYSAHAKNYHAANPEQQDSSISGGARSGSVSSDNNPPKYYTTTRRTSIHSHRDSMKMGKQFGVNDESKETDRAIDRDGGSKGQGQDERPIPKEWREILTSVSAIGNPLSRNEAHTRLKGMHKSRKYRPHFMDPRLFMRVHQLLSNYRFSLPARRFVLDLFKRCLRKMPWGQLDEMYRYCFI